MKKRIRNNSQMDKQMARLSKERVQSIKAGKRKAEPDPPPEPD